MNVGGLFDGCGLLAYGLCLAGLEHRWLCEVDPFRRELLARRWPGVPIFDDVRSVGADSAERVAVIAGGFPCKGASTAGLRNGFDHAETVLWRAMRRVVGELRPRYVVVENVANLLAVRDGAVWAEVLADLAALGFDVVWDCIPAAAFGAPHLRDRVIAIATDARRGGQEPRERLLRAGKSDAERSHQGAAPPSARPQPRGDADQLGLARGRHDVGGGGGAAAYAGGDGLRKQPEPERRGGGAAFTALTAEDAPDSEGRGRSAAEPPVQQSWLAALPRTGVTVEWGNYAEAIARWEAVHGPAPEPLVRRMDARSAARVERSRLSALGDGVQVQLGLLVGAFLMEQER